MGTIGGGLRAGPFGGAPPPGFVMPGARPPKGPVRGKMSFLVVADECGVQVPAIVVDTAEAASMPSVRDWAEIVLFGIYSMSDWSVPISIWVIFGRIRIQFGSFISIFGRLVRNRIQFGSCISIYGDYSMHYFPFMALSFSSPRGHCFFADLCLILARDRS